MLITFIHRFILFFIFYCISGDLILRPVSLERMNLLHHGGLAKAYAQDTTPINQIAECRANKKVWDFTTNTCQDASEDQEQRDPAQCAKMPGRTWNAETNNCDYDKDVTIMHQQIKECRKATNPQSCLNNLAYLNNLANQACENHVENATNGSKSACRQQASKERMEKYKECLSKVDQKEFQDCLRTKGAGTEMDQYEQTSFLHGQELEKAPIFWTQVAFLAAIIVLYGLKKAGGITCTEPSYLTLILTATTTMVAEIGIIINLRNKMEELKKEYEKATKNPEGFKSSEFIDAQKLAFNLLLKSQEHRIEAEKARTIVYSITIAGFAISMGLAIWEATRANQVCKSPAGSSSSVASVTSATTATVSGGSGFLSGLLDKLAKVGEKVYSKAIAIAITRVVLSGILIALSSTLVAHSAQSLKISEHRKTQLEQFKTRILINQQGYYCKSRTDQSVPECYCYDEFGAPDKSKNNSDICKSFWATETSTRYQTATNYNVLDRSEEIKPKFCLDKTDTIDKTCECRKTDSCQKRTFNNLNLQLGNTSFTDALSKIQKDIFNGNLQSGGGVSAGSLVNSAANLNRQNRQKLNELNQQLVNAGQKPIEFGPAVIDKMFKEITKPITPEIAKELAQQGGLSGMGNMMNSLPEGAAEEIKKMEDKIGLKNNELSSVFYGDSSKSGVAKNNQNKNNPFNFDGFDSGSNNQNGDKIQNVPHMNKDYNYKQNDIHSKNDKPIWDILSHRYLKSAYPKLFADE